MSMFFFPKGLAKEADSTAINEYKNKQASDKFKKDTEIANAKETAEKLAAITLEFYLSAGADSRTYGSVSVKEIADKLKSDHAIDIDKRKIVLDKPLKTFGTQILEVKLYPGIVAKLKVSVVPAK